MRTAFIDELMKMAAEDDRICLLTADLGWTVVERFAEAYPSRYLNVGVAEQNMIGMATGLALAGYVPFAYSIATFASMRPYEQIRNGPVLHRLPVRIVGIGGGYAYGHAGPTHYALEDLALARGQPGLVAMAPSDPDQTRSALRATRAIEGPVYLRVGKGGEARVPGLEGRFALGRPEIVRRGAALLILCSGAIVAQVLEAAALLATEGTEATVALLAHLGFQGSAELRDLMSRHAAVLTVEEGYETGGLGSLAAETIVREGLDCRLRVRGVRRAFTGRSGSAAHMRRDEGLDAPSLAAEARRLIADLRHG